MAFSFFGDPFQADPFGLPNPKQPQFDPFQSGSLMPPAASPAQGSSPYSTPAPVAAPFSLGNANQSNAQPSGDAPVNGTTVEPKGPLTGQASTTTGNNGVVAPPNPSGNLFSGLYTDLQDPTSTVQRVLMSMGINPNGGDPRIRSLLQHANQLMAPIFAQLGSGASMDSLEAMVRQQVTSALHGGGVFYSPYEGGQALNGLMQNLWAYDNATRGMGDPSVLANQALANMHSMFTGSANSGDPMQLLNSFMLGGLDPTMQNTLQSQYNQLPNVNQVWVQQHPQSNISMSWLDWFLNPNFRTLPSTAMVNGAYY